MSNRLDEHKRKVALAAWKAHQRTDVRSKFPLSDSQLASLFDSLDAELPDRGCDHTLRLVREWCARADLEPAPVEAWLRDNGGYCDCEALANAGQVFRESRESR
jgi:hypothetical protein